MNSTANDIGNQGIRLNNIQQEPTNPDSIALHRSENAWKPSYKRSHSVDEKEKLRRCVQGTLNRLTFQKFKILLSKIENLKFDKIEDLELLIDLIFVNAIHEPHFSILYANLCKELCQIQLCVVDTTGMPVNFHDCLLIKCLNEFENWCIEKKQETEAASVNYAERRVQIGFEEEIMKIKCRQIGIIRFIGELFKFHLVINATIHECICKLLALQDSKSLELVCEFFKTAGKELDESKLEVNKNLNDENLVDVYFAQLQTIVDKCLTNTRIRFMLQDVIDLRKNNWVPRRIGMVPKTIDEIHKEVELESN